jgi:hypothetical protein
MNKTFYIVFVEKEGRTGTYGTKEDAKKEAQRIANETGKSVYVLESTFLARPEMINSYELACCYLERARCVERNCLYLWDASPHSKAMFAMYKLITIAEAWNKQDDFVPDFTDCDQSKYYPWFRYSGADAGLVCADTYCMPSATSTAIGSRLCFKTHERAKRFGEQFIDLWNDFLLIK